MKNILLCSGSGFSGKNLVTLFRNFKWSNVISLNKKKNKKNYRNIKFIKQDLQNEIKTDFKSEYIILCANKHKISDFEDKSNDSFHNNVMIAKRIIEYSKNKCNRPILIYFSTIDISYKNTPSKKKIYIESKKKSEKLFLNALKNNIFKKVFILRLPAILGKDCNKNFLSETIDKMRLNKTIEIWNSKNLYDNFIHVNDLLRFIIHLIKKHKKYKNKSIFNCTVSKSQTTYQIISLMKKKIKSSSSLIVNPKKNVTLKLNQKNNLKGFKFMSAEETVKLFLKF